MNKFSNIPLKLTAAIMLIIGLVAFILLPTSNPQGILFGKQDNSYNDLNVFSPDISTISTHKNNYSSSKTSNIPSFKSKSSSFTDEMSGVQTDFTPSTYSASEVRNKTNSTVNSYSENIDQSKFSYNYNQQSKTNKYSSTSHIVSIPTRESFSGKTIHPINSEIKSIGIFGLKNQSVSNNSNNSFLTNNTLSITTDLSDNNSAMLIDGESNPSEPGVPVGDGMWLMILFLGIYYLKNRIARDSNLL